MASENWAPRSSPRPLLSPPPLPQGAWLRIPPQPHYDGFPWHPGLHWEMTNDWTWSPGVDLQPTPHPEQSYQDRSLHHA